MNRFEALCRYVTDTITRDADGNVDGDPLEIMATARLVIGRTARYPTREPWPGSATKFLQIAGEVALCVLIDDRVPGHFQPGLPILLRQLSNEAWKLPTSPATGRIDFRCQVGCFGIIVYAAQTASALDTFNRTQPS
jgi:hypothetical protein